ncbi:Lipid A biosynthesis lauroyl acyltransferase [Sinorhizobium sojae CCBAU 05684]|uniref:Lipid A biosynthesis lauroyl acyltransferase n=1 Tax=Sinorhizobium sojae CCBAU 05684 TaxID=716928 RepID=A0A249PC09_9HYPH|nr:lipid A biosynthesis lauroyl acyltransferase [Sinorhizobium sojae]ASY63366.1 Lipid A biosynthesis lauroyl acyltransferase [Sinorhizobium sojae CCBAU 05684]
MLITRLVLAADRFRQWAIAQFVLLLLSVLKLLPPDAAINFMDRVARWIGPKTRRHRLTLTNLRNAFPEKGEAEIKEIALESWGNMGRLAAEYVFLDRLFDFDPERAEPGRVEVSGIPLFMELRDNPRPFIVFTAHSGNFEMLPVAGSAFGLEVTVLFRPPNNPYLADKVFEFRKARMGNLVPSHAGSSFALARQLERGGGVGVLVDQKFRKGLKTKFFGRDVQTNPLLAKLVRQFNCEVYPARCIRLPGGRFRLELEPAVEIPRRADGSVDVTATAQMLNDKVESWVREYPGQWLWYHDRWHIKRNL